MSNNDFGNIPNPYQAAAPAPGGPPPGAKPVSLTVFGIINIVWGALGLCGFVGTGVQYFVLSAQQQQAPNPVFDLMRDNATYFGYMMASMVLGFFATIALITGGIGLLNGKMYGRTLSIAYALYAIVFGILGIVFNLLFLITPMMEQLGNVPQGPQRTGAMAGFIGVTVGSGLCGLIYPIVLLIFMMRAPIVNYLRSQQQHV